MARKAVKHGTDSKGQKIALVDNGDDTFTVLIKCANYAAHVRGGIAHTWRWAGQTEMMSRDAACKLFNSRNSVAA